MLQCNIVAHSHSKDAQLTFCRMDSGVFWVARGPKAPPLAARLWVKIVHNVCGLACILGITSPNNLVSLTTKKCSAQGIMCPPWLEGRKGTKSPYTWRLKNLKIHLHSDDTLFTIVFWVRNDLFQGVLRRCVCELFCFMDSRVRKMDARQAEGL